MENLSRERLLSEFLGLTTDILQVTAKIPEYSGRVSSYVVNLVSLPGWDFMVYITPPETPVPSIHLSGPIGPVNVKFTVNFSAGPFFTGESWRNEKLLRDLRQFAEDLGYYVLDPSLTEFLESDNSGELYYGFHSNLIDSGTSDNPGQITYRTRRKSHDDFLLLGLYPGSNGIVVPSTVVYSGKPLEITLPEALAEFDKYGYLIMQQNNKLQVQ